MHADSDAYTHLAIKTMHDARRIVNEHFARLPWSEEEYVLDAGCGSGETTKGALLPACPPGSLKKIYAFDLLEDMIRKANTVNAHPKIEYRVGDFGNRSSLPAEWEGLFSKAFSNYAMHWVPQPKSATSTIYQLLKPGGHFVVAFLIGGIHWETADLLRKRPTWQPYCTKQRTPQLYFMERSDEHIRSWFEDVGFRVLTLKRQHSSQILDTREHFEVTIQSIGQYYEDIPEHLRSQWVQEFAEEVLKRTGGIYDIFGEIAIVVAQKPT